MQTAPAPLRRAPTAAFYAWELEALACHYERDPADPRLGHQLTLQVDDYGNVTKSATRRLPAADARRSPSRQRRWSRYTEHDVDQRRPEQTAWYRIGLPAEIRTYELTGIVPAPGTGCYDPADLLAAAAAAADIPYEATRHRDQPRSGG